MSNLAITDRQNYDAIVALIKATGYFDTVAFGSVVPRYGEDNPVAWVQPWKFRETAVADDTDTLRRVTYRLNIIVRCSGEADSEPFDRLDQLARVCQSAVEGQSLAGCYASETTLSEGTFPDRPTPGGNGSTPSYTLNLIGNYEYDVPVYLRPLIR